MLPQATIASQPCLMMDSPIPAIGQVIQEGFHLISTEESPNSGRLEIVILDITSGRETWVPFAKTEAPQSIKDFGLSMWTELQVKNQSVGERRFAPDQFKDMRKLLSEEFATGYVRVDEETVKEGTPMLEWRRGGDLDLMHVFGGRNVEFDRENTGWRLTLAGITVFDPLSYRDSLDLGFAKWNDRQALRDLVELMRDTEDLMITAALLYPDEIQRMLLREEMAGTKDASTAELETNVTEIYERLLSGGLVKSGKILSPRMNLAHDRKYPGSFRLESIIINKQEIPFAISLESGFERPISENEYRTSKMKRHFIVTMSKKLSERIDRIAGKRGDRLQSNLNEWLKRAEEALATLSHWRIVEDPHHRGRKDPTIVLTCFSEDVWLKFLPILTKGNNTFSGRTWSYRFIPTEFDRV